MPWNLWSEAREVGKLTIASATDEDLEKISRMRIPRASGDKIPPFILLKYTKRSQESLDEYNELDDPSEREMVTDTNSPAAKAQVKRMIKWLSLK